jgi:hypothetical protein
MVMTASPAKIDRHRDGEMPRPIQACGTAEMS